MHLNFLCKERTKLDRECLEYFLEHVVEIFM